MKKKNHIIRKGQTFLEYSFLIAIAIAALITMFEYVNRGVQGSLKDSIDSLGGAEIAGSFVSPGTAHGIEQGTSQMRKSTSTFSYEGGQYEGSLFTGNSHRTETIQFTGSGHIGTRNSH